MQPVLNLRCREQGESSLQHIMSTRVTLGTGEGGSFSDPGMLRDPQKNPKLPQELSLKEQQEQRRKINSRERKRMQDLNLAMDALREVMLPYASSPSSTLGVGGGLQHPYLPLGTPLSGRRLSKISTLVLARNYILILSTSLQEMRRLLGEISTGGTVPHLLLAGGCPFFTGQGQLLLNPPEQPLGLSPMPMNSAPAQEESTVWGSRGVAGTPLCHCGVCRVPRMLHALPTSCFQK
ncbi:oligodendrocyte transcription factor 1 [Trichomycterus rosablanca]|uniref:oligodendrocyte transcription factor 1 n=1 Tax=Trichomycterus rosablanca TaxID=2290929 RepID=UPI002F355A07